MKPTLKTQVLIIGGGITGTGLARDLALRGVHCILAEQFDINAGASGSNHGLLHSGGRYVGNDLSAAKECQEEGAILKRLGPHCIENTGGLFVAVEGDDEKYIADFPHRCAQCDIETEALTVEEARELEPALSDKLIAAYKVPDSTVDPFMLSLENIWQAQELGSVLMRNTRVMGFEKRGGRIEATRLLDRKTGEERRVDAEQIVNAAGAWGVMVASLAGATIDMLFSKGTLLVTFNRITKHVVNRLRLPSDADILVPGGTVSLLGTTSVQVDSMDDVYPTVEEVDLIVDEESTMVPSLTETRYVRAYSGVRPLLLEKKQTGDSRSVSRGFALFGHEEDRLDNFLTITGGKFTTYRVMAERTADRVCARLGVTKPCRTRKEPLPSTYAGKWTETGLAPEAWIRKHDPDDLILCECEMVPQSAIDAVIASIRQRNDEPDIDAIGLRSRVGKGPCQGTYCSVKIAAHMVDRGEATPGLALKHLREFLRRRWRGQHPILWGRQMDQVELLEAFHCGVFGQELTAREE